jgi:hypothetical protein
VSEGSGRSGRLKHVLNARMEEMRFRTGVVVVAALLAVAGLGIGFGLVLGGGHPAAEVTPAASAHVTRSPVPLSSSAFAASSPSARPRAIQDAHESAAPVAEQSPQPETTTTRARSPKPSAAATSPWPTPHYSPRRPTGTQPPPRPVTPTPPFP